MGKASVIDSVAGLRLSRGIVLVVNPFSWWTRAVLLASQFRARDSLRRPQKNQSARAAIAAPAMRQTIAAPAAAPLDTVEICFPDLAVQVWVTVGLGATVGLVVSPTLVVLVESAALGCEDILETEERIGWASALRHNICWGEAVALINQKYAPNAISAPEFRVAAPGFRVMGPVAMGI
jgi:hypothetical protein